MLGVSVDPSVGIPTIGIVTMSTDHYRQLFVFRASGTQDPEWHFDSRLRFDLSTMPYVTIHESPLIHLDRWLVLPDLQSDAMETKQFFQFRTRGFLPCNKTPRIILPIRKRPGMSV
jgi:hypothetical protein